MTQQVLDANAGHDLEGLPGPVNVPGHGPLHFHSNRDIQSVANSYNAQNGLPTHPNSYTPVDPGQGARVAQAYDEMEHNPNDPEVKEAYDALAREVRGQYDHAVKNGYNFEFYPEGQDPYPNSPREAVMDLHHNKHMYVYPTANGYGMDENPTDHPLLQDSGVRWGGQPVTHNDLFRAIHDFYGHAKEGVGFRAAGEDNAFRQHAAMFTPPAQRALASETRGQNSWVNYNPVSGQSNQTAGQADTVFAPQKAGLLPTWASDPNLHTQVPQQPAQAPQTPDWTPVQELQPTASGYRPPIASETIPLEQAMAYRPTEGSTWDDVRKDFEFNHPDMMNGLRDDMSKRGMITPVTIDRNTGEVTNGHHRLLVAQDIGMTHVPVNYDGEPEGGQWTWNPYDRKHTWDADDDDWEDESQGTTSAYDWSNQPAHLQPAQHKLDWQPGTPGKGFITTNGAVWTWPTQNMRPQHMQYAQKVNRAGLQVKPNTAFHIEPEGRVWQYNAPGLADFEKRRLDPSDKYTIQYYAPKSGLWFGEPGDAPPAPVQQDEFGHATGLLDRIQTQPEPQQSDMAVTAAQTEQDWLMGNPEQSDPVDAPSLWESQNATPHYRAGDYLPTQPIYYYPDADVMHVGQPGTEHAGLERERDAALGDNPNFRWPVQASVRRYDASKDPNPETASAQLRAMPPLAQIHGHYDHPTTHPNSERIMNGIKQMYPDAQWHEDYFDQPTTPMGWGRSEPPVTSSRVCGVCSGRKYAACPGCVK